MQKMFTAVIVQSLATGLLLLSPVSAQQSSAASSQTGTSKSSTAAKSTAKKPASTSGAPGAAILKTQKQKNSYALGVNMAQQLHQQVTDVDPAMVARGVRDQLSGAKSLMTEDEMKATLQQLKGELVKEYQAKEQAQKVANRKAGESFLTANKAKTGVTTLADGLQYKVLKEGSGPKPTANDTVTVNYRGTLIDGKEFDSSYKRGQPATFPVGGVIKGWTEALQLMPVGSKWELYIPADLAYGDQGRPGIEPGDTLVFEVELLSIGGKK